MLTEKLTLLNGHVLTFDGFEVITGVITDKVAELVVKTDVPQSLILHLNW